MLIRFGYEITVRCAAPVPMLLALSPHSSFRGRLIGSDDVRPDPDVPVRQNFDLFGNRVSRIVAPPGGLKIWSDCIAESDGLPDGVFPAALQHAGEDLPFETLTYLSSSRYCESDELVGDAWRMFGGTEPGWSRVQAICDFVHSHLTFGYRFGRPTKTAPATCSVTRSRPAPTPR